MLIRGQTTEERIAEIAQGFQKGVEGYSAGQRRYNEAENQERKYQETVELRKADLAEKAAARQRAIEELEIKKKENIYKDEQRNKKPEERDAVLEKIAVNKAKPIKPVMTYQEKLEEQDKFNTNKAIKASSISDFDIANPEIIPTPKDAEEVKKLNSSNKSFQNIGSRVSERMKTFNPRDPRAYITNDWKLIQQDITEMRLQAKELAKLGVLNGPDLTLVDETLGGLSPSNLALLGSDKARERIQAALKTAQDKLDFAASARGYKPKTSNIQSASVQTSQNVPVTQENKPIATMSRAEKIKLLRGN
jgi:hypothetical protein